MTPAELIAANLSALPHPDGGVRQLAGYSTALLPDALRDQVESSARDIGEAVVYLLESNGYRIESGPAPAAQPETEPTVAHVHCLLCDTRLLSMNIVEASHVTVDGRRLVESVAARSPECPHASV